MDSDDVIDLEALMLEVGEVGEGEIGEIDVVEGSMSEEDLKMIAEFERGELPNDDIREDDPELRALMNNMHAASPAVTEDYAIPSGDAEYAKSVAISLKKQGRNKLAMEWLLYSKVTSGAPLKKKVAGKVQGAAVVKTRGPQKRDHFSALEDAINKALANRVPVLQRTPEANEREKSYIKHLTTIANMRMNRPDIPPPAFQWVINKKLAPSELISIPEDSIQVLVTSAQNLEASLAKCGGGTTLSVSYNLGIPRDNPVEGKTGKAEYISAKESVVWDHKHYHDLPNTKQLPALLKRAKVEFILRVSRGFLMFSSKEEVGRATLSLEGLLSSCECGGTLELMAPPKEGTKSKAVGGSISVSLRMRRPVSSERAATIVDETILVIEDWPIVPKQVSVASSPAPSEQRVSAEVSPKGPRGQQQTSLVQLPEKKFLSPHSEIPCIQKTKENSKTRSSPLPLEQSLNLSVPVSLREGLSDEEMGDPGNTKHIVSNEVLEHEIKLLKCQGSLSGSNKVRLQELEFNLQYLVADVQNERLTIEDYLAEVEHRIVQDRRLVGYLTACGRNDEAKSVSNRISIMEEEVKTAPT